MGWSKKYKRSIDCNNPKGFSQKAHCAGRKKRESKMSLKLEELVGKKLTEEQFDEAAGKKDACYYKVKARYDVWPSAYASGALVKCRKVGAKNWGNKSKKEGVKEAVSPKGWNMSKKFITILAREVKNLQKYHRQQNEEDFLEVANYMELQLKYMKKNLNESLNEKKNDYIVIGKNRKGKSIKVTKDKTKKYGIGGVVMTKSQYKKRPDYDKKRIKGVDHILTKVGKQSVYLPIVFESVNEGLDDLKALPKDLKKSIKKNREEGFASDAQRRAAFASGYKAKGKKKKKKEGVNETTYKFKGYTASNMDELDAMLSRAGIKGTPNFNDMTYSVNKKSSKIDRIMKMKGGKKIKPIRLRGKSGMGKISHLGMESVEEARGTCWVGYQQLGMKRKGGKMVPNCVKEITELYYEIDGKGYGYTFEYINDGKLNEAEYQGRKVKLGKIMQGDVKKFKVYVKNPKGNVVKVNFGQGGKSASKTGGTMRIRKSNPKARANFRARHNCDNPGPRHKARYWACRTW